MGDHQKNLGGSHSQGHIRLF